MDWISAILPDELLLEIAHCSVKVHSLLRATSARLRTSLPVHHFNNTAIVHQSRTVSGILDRRRSRKWARPMKGFPKELHSIDTHAYARPCFYALTFTRRIPTQIGWFRSLAFSVSIWRKPGGRMCVEIHFDNDVDHVGTTSRWSSDGLSWEAQFPIRIPRDYQVILGLVRDHFSQSPLPLQ